jgi:hypothetical protein
MPGEASAERITKSKQHSLGVHTAGSLALRFFCFTRVTLIAYELVSKMPLAQAEADRLLGLPKEFTERGAVEFTVSEPLNFQRSLISVDRRERFILDVERGRRKRTRLKYQTRAREILFWRVLNLTDPIISILRIHHTVLEKELDVLTSIYIAKDLKIESPLD